ncbi:MAG: 6-phosphogluconolactonase [Enterobacterales bacterium]|jgi:6-phosphogluconolactonase
MNVIKGDCVMSRVIERFYNDEKSFNHSVESNISYLLSKAIEERGQATFLVSAGKTPKFLYKSLSNTELFWNQVKVATVDERWVETNDKLSNEQLIRSTLLQNNAKGATFHGMKTDAKHAIDAISDINKTYASFNAPFDITVLGMGNDGHTASLFPRANDLDDSSSLCRSIQMNNNEQTTEVNERVTLTLSSLLQSKVIFLLLRGKEKLKTYQKAMDGTDAFEMPIRAILQQNKIPVVVNWAP